MNFISRVRTWVIILSSGVLLSCAAHQKTVTVTGAASATDYAACGNTLKSDMEAEEAGYKSTLGTAPHTAAKIGIVSGGIGTIASTVAAIVTNDDSKTYINAGSAVISVILIGASAWILEGESDDRKMIVSMDAAIGDWVKDISGAGGDASLSKAAFQKFVTAAANIKANYPQLTFLLPSCAPTVTYHVVD